MEVYGFLEAICNNGEDHEVEPITPDQYMPVEAEIDGVAPISLVSAVITGIRETAIGARNKEVLRWKELRSKFYAFIEHVSSDSM